MGETSEGIRNPSGGEWNAALFIFGGFKGLKQQICLTTFFVICGPLPYKGPFLRLQEKIVNSSEGERGL